MMKSNNDERLTTYAAVLVDDRLWFSARECNGLFCMDLADEVTHFVKPFPKASVNFFQQHIKAILYNDQIIFIPLYGWYIHIYDLNSGDISYICIGKRKKGIWYARDAFLLNDCIYTVPYDIEGDMQVYNLQSGEVSANTTFRTACVSYLRESMQIASNRGFFSAKSYMEGNKLYFSIFPYKLIGCFDYISSDLKFRQTEAGCILGLYIYNGELFLLCADDVNIHGLKNNGFGDEYVYCSELSYDNLDGEHRPFLSMMENSNGLFTVPAFARNFLKFEGNSFVSVNDLSDYVDVTANNKLLFYSIVKDCENLILPSLVDGYIYLFNQRMELIKKIPMECSDNEYIEYRMITRSAARINRSRGSYIVESDDFSLTRFLRAMAAEDDQQVN